MTRIFVFIFLFAISCLCLIWAISSSKVHDFEGKCTMCHMDGQNLTLVDQVDVLCYKCHIMNKEKSHPVNIKPDKAIPLTMHLDKNGQMTCVTCHDVHKEDKTQNKAELSGLLWGHVQGKAFCLLCHNDSKQDATWRHQTAIQYAHPAGKLTETSSGSILDKTSTECLSCHDGTISKFPQVEVRQGVWQHGIGMSHPIGVDYPRSEEFTYAEALPKQIQLFDGKLGCLSCHDIYSKEANMLVMDNRKSKLCLTCHRK